MSNTNVEQLILRMESYLECWKQFNTFMSMARSKKFSQEDENQFLEIKEFAKDYAHLERKPYRLGGARREAASGPFPGKTPSRKQ